MPRLLSRWLLLLVLTLAGLAPAHADEIADLLSRLEGAGARIVRLPPGDARLNGEGRVATGIGPGGRVEVYLPEGGRAIRTPLRTPVERLTVEEFRNLTGEMRTAIRELYGITVERVYIAGSSSGIPFTDPNTGELRTFDRKGPRTSDYDGAVVSAELYEKVKAENPRAVRGGGTGKRTSPDPLPGIRAKFHDIGERWGRKVACMVYASEAEFQKRMQLTGLTVGENVMAEPTTGANAVTVTRAELLGALIEVEQLKRLVAAKGEAGAKATLTAAAQGNVQAQEAVRAARRAATTAMLEGGAGLSAVDRGLLTNELLRLEAPRKFALPREAARAPPPGLAFAEAEVREVFDRVREGAATRASERAAALPAGADRAAVTSGLARVREAGLELVRTSAVSIEYLPETNSVRVSTGLLDKLAGEAGASAEGRAWRTRALGLLFGHELGHAAGIRGEALADAEAVRALERAGVTLERADARRVVDLFARGGSGRLADALNTLRGLPTYGTPGSRTARLTRAIEGAEDPLSRFRRVDGTLDWRRLTADRALGHGAGLAHFGLALFLKELAVVVETGDRARIDEFFEGLLTTDFFVTYGAFTIGARAGDVAYSRFLAKHVKPRFAGAVLRTNVVLATGMALPALIHGELDGRAFVVDVVGLGLSSTAVRAGLAGIEWVVDLKRLEAAGGLARTATRLRSLAKAGSFLYTAAETAVVLYLGEKLSAAANRALDERAAKDAVADRTLELLAAARAGASPARLAELLDRFQEAHIAYRDLLLRDVVAAEATYNASLARAARAAKVMADERAAAESRLRLLPALRASVVARHGSVEAYLDSLTRDRRAELEADLERAMTTLERARAAALRAVYDENRRGGAYLPSGGRAAEGLLGYFERLGVRSELRNLSGNRSQAYDDELAALAHVRAAVANDPARRALVDDAIATTSEIGRRDRALFRGDEPAAAPTPGLRGVLERE